MTTDILDNTSVLEQIQATDRQFVMQNYTRRPICFVQGKGAKLWDVNGKEYLDFLAGIAVCGVGHCHPTVAEAISGQASKLMHVSNLFYNELQPELAKRLAYLTGMERAFFCNSGAEANECAIKIARKWAKRHKGRDCFEIITFYGSFHGRTLATVTATAQPKYQEAFAPLPAGFKYCHVGDLEELKNTIGPQTAAIMIEPIQGESGVKPVPVEFLKQIRELCDENHLLLILDEVQCGLGRTGHFLASQGMGVTGDIVTLAKSIADGMPMGVCLASGDAGTTLVPGDHGSTFGGQPLACAAALAVLDVMEAENLIDHAGRVGALFMVQLHELQSRYPTIIQEVRGAGLMIGVEFKVPIAVGVLDRLLALGIVANAIGDNVIRLVPPLVVSEQDCDKVAHALDLILNERTK